MHIYYRTLLIKKNVFFWALPKLPLPPIRATFRTAYDRKNTDDDDDDCNDNYDGNFDDNDDKNDQKSYKY